MLIIKKTFRWIIYATLLILTLMIVIAAIISFVIFPNIDQYKDDISTMITEKISLKTSIGNIVTGWDGLSPKILISEIDIYDTDHTSALHLENVKGTFSWLSIPLLHPHLSNISVSNPELTVRRKTNGSIYIAGIPLAGEGKPDLANWLLSQAKISVKNAAIVWQDDLRQAPRLSLDKVYLKLNNPAWRKIFGQHLFTLTVQPSTGTEHPIQMNGHFFGRDISKIESWHGEVNIETQDVDLTAWKAWLDYPIDLQSGAGNTKVALGFSNKQLNKLKADIVLHDVSGKLSEASQPFNAELLSGLITWESAGNMTTVTAKRIKLKSENELDIDGGSGLISHTIKNKKPWINASLNLGTFNLSFIEKIQKVITFPENISKPLNALAPQGQLNDFSISLQGNPKEPTHYRIASTFKSLNVNAYNQIPGFKNLSGEIEANENSGALQLASRNASLDFKEVLRWPIPAKKLNGKVSWSKDKDRLKIIANDISISNEHISGTINSSYDLNGFKGGYLDLSAKFDNGNAKFAPFYYPTIMGKDTINWLDTSILSGKANNVQLTVKGNLDDFPYVDKNNRPDPTIGIFKVTARISDAVLEYGKSWPKIEALGLDMLFEGNSMELNADKGKVFDFNIVRSKVTIPQLNTYGAKAQVLNIESEGKGPVSEGIKFINASPVKNVTLGFTDDLKTSGIGNLKLSLKIPLSNIDSSTYKGEYTITDGSMLTHESIGLPEITHIDTKLDFNETGINAKKINGEMLGGPVKFSLNSEPDKTIRINAGGTVTASGIKNIASNAFSESLSGSASWTADIAIKKPVMNLNIQSDLKGLEINLPAPIGKDIEQQANLVITKKQIRAEQDTFEMHFNDTVSAIILRNKKNGDLTFDRGDIAINTPAKFPTETGLTLHGEFDYINADEWLELTKKSTGTDSTPQKKSSTLSLNRADLSIQKLDFFNRSLNALNITAKPSNNNVLLTLTSQELDGDVEWRAPSSTDANGRIIAKLKKLHIPASSEDNTEPPEDANKDIRSLDRKYPALDVKADDFKLGAKAFGALELKAYEVDEDWVIEQLKISSPDNTLLADGRWHNWSGSPNTNLKFSLTANDVGNTLNRFGYPETVKGGIALISGQLQWPGSPHEFKTTGLNGEFRLGASKGQILKVQPGVGRLLGLLTLQSLPRRLTLDFRDLFSEGFAFDEISGTAKLSNGVMISNDFFMTGPAAETEIKGEINLNDETQNLNVKVVPHISDSLSLAALVGGPIAGAAAFVAQKLLKDPLNKIAQSNYTIAGTWDNPIEVDVKVKKEQTADSPLNAQQN
jgi:uncharacterized protein (TIGR02099 family)